MSHESAHQKDAGLVCVSLFASDAVGDVDYQQLAEGRLMNALLTFRSDTEYFSPAAAKSVAGTYHPELNKRRSAPLRIGAFLCLSFMAGRAQILFGGASSFCLVGGTSAYRLATLCTTKFGKSPKSTKGDINV